MSFNLTAWEAKAVIYDTRNTSSSCPFWEVLCLWRRSCLCFMSPPGQTLHQSKADGWNLQRCGQKTEHYQKFLTKHFLEQDLAARIVKLKGTVSLKSSCTSPSSFCNWGNTVFKRNWVMVMAEEHGMYKGLAPGDRARGVKNNGGLLRRGRASLLCQCCNSKVLSVENKKKTRIPQPSSLFLTLR